MGIFDFLGDLSSKRNKELGLGGLQSLLGTRKAAEAGARGDEMMKITGSDSLPGYFNEQTREYVPWYVDLFDGGGLNSAGGAANAEAPAADAGLLGSGPSPRGASVQAQAAPDFQYDYPTEFRPSPELSSMQSLEQPFGSRIVPVSTAGPSSQPDSNRMLVDLYAGNGRDMPTMPNPYIDEQFTSPAPPLPPPAETARPVNENSLLDRALSGELAKSNRAALNGNASDSNPPLPQSQSVGPTEFERFKSKFEKQLKANGLWGFPDKIQEILDGLNARGLNY